MIMKGCMQPMLMQIMTVQLILFTAVAYSVTERLFPIVFGYYHLHAHPLFSQHEIRQGGNLRKIPGGTAIAYKVENALKSPKPSKCEVETRWHGAASGDRRAGHGRVRLPSCYST